MSSTSSQLGDSGGAGGNNLRKCKTCKELRPEEKFKTNGYDKYGNRTRMATCRTCMEASKTSDNVVIELAQTTGRAFETLAKTMIQLKAN